MKKNLVNVLTTENEVMEHRKALKERISLTRAIIAIEDKDIDYDVKMKEVRELFKERGFSRKEINRRIRNKEDLYMEEQTKNEIAIFKDGKVLVSFTAEEFNYLDNLIYEAIAFSDDGLNELRKDEEKIKGWAYGSLTDMIEMDVFDRSRDRITRYKKRLAKAVLDKIKYNYDVKEEDGLFIVEEIYNFKRNSAIGII